MSRSLFEKEETQLREAVMPLAARMRPRTLEEFTGQRHLLEPGRLLQRLIQADRLGSVILHGPPGCGKTTLARLLAKTGSKPFHSLSAVSDGVAQLRKILQEARSRTEQGKSKSVVFVDEIHRFHKGQQDALLEDVENGVIDLIGATTSNPYFAVNSALLSRSQVFQFEALENAEVVDLLMVAIKDEERGYGKDTIVVQAEALEVLAELSGGDARRALGGLEVAVLSSAKRPLELTVELIRDCVPRSAMGFDASGDQHYDLASALIKSVRGSDVDAAIYWLARALESGEDVRFLCRRLLILASEDIGNAAPQALQQAVACMQTCEFIGLPECQLTLSQTVIYLACCPKSNAATVAISLARKDVRDKAVIPVPKHLRDGHYQGAKELGHATEYKYSHTEADGVAQQDYLGVDRQYYMPTDRGFEAELSRRLETIRRQLKGKD